MGRRYLQIWSFVTVFVVLSFFAIRFPIECMAVEPDMPSIAESSEPEPEQEVEPEPEQESEPEPEQESEPEPEQESEPEIDYSGVGNLNMSEVVSMYVAVLQIRNCLIFLIFGVVPLLVACLIVYLFMRWIYRLILSAV